MSSSLFYPKLVSQPPLTWEISFPHLIDPGSRQMAARTEEIEQTLNDSESEFNCVSSYIQHLCGHLALLRLREWPRRGDAIPIDVPLSPSLDSLCTLAAQKLLWSLQCEINANPNDLGLMLEYNHFQVRRPSVKARCSITRTHSASGFKNSLRRVTVIHSRGMF